MTVQQLIDALTEFDRDMPVKVIWKEVFKTYTRYPRSNIITAEYGVEESETKGLQTVVLLVTERREDDRNNDI